MKETIDTQAVRDYLLELQQRIVRELERLDGARFVVSNWERPQGAQLRGRGATCILEDGALFERAGIGFSQVGGDRLPPSASAAHPEVAGCGFDALGVSLVLHPRNPYVPTVHMNVRFFHAHPSGEAAGAWWFGGGFVFVQRAFAAILDLCGPVMTLGAASRRPHRPLCPSG